MAAALLMLAFFHMVIFSRLAFRKQEVEPDRDLPVSVVICGRNESIALQQLIPLLLDQDHREFELIVVNDRSEDDTWEVLQWMKPQYANLKPVNIQADEKFSYGKKIALGVGVRSAKYPNVLVVHELVSQSFLQAVRPRRVRWHPLVQTYIQTHFPPDESQIDPEMIMVP